MNKRRVREKKKLEQKRRQDRIRSDQKACLERVLMRLGLLKGFRGLSSAVRERVIQMLPSHPVVSLEPTLNNHPYMDYLKKDIEKVLLAATLRSDDGADLLVSDYLLVLSALPYAFHRLSLMPLPDKQRQFLEEAAEKAYSFQVQWEKKMLLSLSIDLQITMLMDSRIDQGVYGYIEYPQLLRPGKPMFRLTLMRRDPRVSSVEIDGKVRRVYQCGLPVWRDGIKWMEADGESFGLDRGCKLDFSCE